MARQRIPSTPGRKLCWFAAAASAGIFGAVYLLSPGQLLPAGAFCALAALLCLPFRGGGRWRVILTAFGLAAGLLYTAGFGLVVRAPAEALVHTENKSLSFTVTDFPRETSRGASVPAKLTLAGAPDPKVTLYADGDALTLRPGDVISTQASLRTSRTYRGESSDYFPSRGIYLIAYTDGVTLTQRPARVSPRFWPQFAAKALKDSISGIFPADVSGFITALITGDKSQLPTGLYAAFQRSGLSHVVAVSGLHVSFLAGLIALFLGKRGRLSAALGIALVFFFAAIVGNTPSVLRAAFMQTLLLLAPLVKREADKPTMLSLVLLLVLLPCPYTAASVSLQLSFAAVAGIYLITGPLYTRWVKLLPKAKTKLQSRLKAVPVFVFGTLATTFGALLFTTPLVALYFHTLSLAGPVTNLLTLWAVSGTFLGGLIAALTGLWLPGPGSALAWLVAWPARWVMWVAKAIARLPFAALSLSDIYLIGWFIFACAAVLLCLCFRKKGLRPGLTAMVCVITLCVALPLSVYSAQSGTLTVSVLDVGQGASALFLSKGHAVLVDCGGNSADDPGDIAANAIQARGLSKLDALVLTHCHSDHACGVPELLSRIDVSTIILPDVEPDAPLRQEILSLAELYECKVILLSDDTYLTFGEAAMELYAPLGSGGTNELGLSVLCTAGDFKLLLTGDMDDTIERRLVKYKDLPDIDVLIAGHHGSRSSTSEELLRATTPELAVISSGWNSYGHPADETLERLGAAGCGVYLTKDRGTVTFTYRDEKSGTNVTNE